VNVEKGLAMADETIPLWDGEPSDAEIIHPHGSNGAATKAVRTRRRSPRRCYEGVHVCFSPDLPSGLLEHIECPVIDLSARGLAIEFDRRLEIGVTGYISYQTVSHQPVRVSCRVRRCSPLEDGHYRLGIRFDRNLRPEERMPAKVRPGREVSPGIRARKLRGAAEKRR
jgi:hypothetical protein